MDEGNKRAALVAKIIDDSGKLLSAVLIGNNIVNISCSALVTTFTIKVWGSYATGIATGVLTLFVLLFGEITPKNLATYYSVKLTLLYAPIIYGLMVILTPVIFIVDHLAGGVLRIFGIKSNDKNSTITEEELRTIVKVSHEEGIIEKDERQIIDNLFDFGDTSVKDVMIPRIDMTLADVSSSYDDIISLFRQTMYTRIPIYENTPDNVIGILNIKDLIVNPSDNDTFNIRNIIRKPFFTFEQKNTSDLFKEMQLSSTSIAIVLSEYGTTSGMITTEDLLEEIVGEIRDEYDADEEDDITRISDREFYVLGSANLNDVSEALSLHFTSDDYDTIGGYCLGLLDHLPEKNEIILTDNNILLRIDRMEKNRIERIYIRLPEPLEETSSEQKSEE